MTLAHWLYWLVAFLIVIAILVVAAAMQEWWLWRKDSKGL